MSLTIPYHDTDRFIADPLSDPLCRMIADEAEAEAEDIDWGTIDALIETELAQRHVKSKHELNFD